VKRSKLFRLVVALVLLLAVIAPADAATLCTFGICFNTPDLFANSRQQKEDECWEQYQAKLWYCRRMISGRNRELCFSNAATAYGSCMKKAGGR
jgi:hypothetical protein